MNFLEFISENKGVEFRYLVIKKMFTPYEQSKKFFDESIYENTEYNFAYITKVITLPDGDLLLELQDSECHASISYYKLSEIELSRWIEQDK